MVQGGYKSLVWMLVFLAIACFTACSGEGGGTIGTPPGSDTGEADTGSTDVTVDVAADVAADVQEDGASADTVDAGGPGGPCGTYAETIQPIFDTCVGCHGSLGGLTLTADVALDQLVGVDSVGSSMPRVDPGNPDNSSLVLKVEGDPSVGSPMPLGSPTGLDPALAAHIRAWVEAGAPDGEYGVCGEDTGAPDVIEDVVDVVDDPGVIEPDVAVTDSGGGNLNCSSFEATIYPIFESKGCTSGYCHGVGTTPPNLNPDQAFWALVGADSMYSDGLKLVVPDSPDTSFLVEKLESGSPAFGGQMPLGGNWLAQTELDLIRYWISIGAPSAPYDCVEVDEGGGEDTSEPADVGSDEGSAEDIPVGPPPSWAADIAPIMSAKCTPCHTANPNCSGGTCFVDSYADTQTDSNSCVGPMSLCMWMRSDTGSMPLGGGCGLEPTGPNCLTAEELGLLEAWANAGGPE
jgi:hypothetical protein